MNQIDWKTKRKKKRKKLVLIGYLEIESVSKKGLVKFRFIWNGRRPKKRGATK